MSEPSDQSSSYYQPDSIFPPTEWDLIGQENSTVDDLDALVRKYLRPLVIHFLNKFPVLQFDADRFVLEFIEDRVLKEGWLNKAAENRKRFQGEDRKRGRFRDLLKTSLKNYVIDKLRRVRDETSIDDGIKEQPLPQEEDDALNLEWSKFLLDKAITRMREYCHKPGKKFEANSRAWEIFQVQLLNPILRDEPAPPYSELVKRLKLRSPTEGYNLLGTAKRMFERFLLAEVARYEGQAGAELELDALKEFLARISQKKDDKRNQRKNEGID